MFGTKDVLDFWGKFTAAWRVLAEYIRLASTCKAYTDVHIVNGEAAAKRGRSRGITQKLKQIAIKCGF